MPRSSGNYTPPTGQPVITGTTISSTVHNTLIADLGNEITNSLPRDGTAPPTANIPLGNFKITGSGAATANTDLPQYQQIQSGASQYLTGLSGTNTIVATLATPALAAYATGNTFRFVASGANTGAVTINVNGLGAKSITKNGATPLVTGDILAGAAIEIIYDGTRFQLVGNASIADSSVTTAKIADSAVTTVKLADGSVNGAKLEDITTAETVGSAYSIPVMTKDVNGRVTSATTAAKITSGTAIPTNAGGLAYDFTGIPAGVKRITLMIAGVSTTGVSPLLVQLIASGTPVTSGYLGACDSFDTAPSPTLRTTGLGLEDVGLSSYIRHGIVEFYKLDGNTWVGKSQISLSDAAARIGFGTTSIALGSALSGIRLTTVGGAEAFDAGSINILME